MNGTMATVFSIKAPLIVSTDVTGSMLVWAIRTWKMKIKMVPTALRKAWEMR